MSQVDSSKVLIFILVCVGLLLPACSQIVMGAPTQDVKGGDPARGRDALRSYGCGSCHSIPGILGATAQVGPPLDHFGNRRFVAGILPNLPDNLVKWIMNPQAVVPGNAMPNLNVNDAAARDMAAYLYTLQ